MPVGRLTHGLTNGVYYETTREDRINTHTYIYYIYIDRTGREGFLFGRAGTDGTRRFREIVFLIHVRIP